jgi:hypothetical protein
MGKSNVEVTSGGWKRETPSIIEICSKTSHEQRKKTGNKEKR